MLKVSSIKFIDSRNREYTINNNQIEFFPFIGGENANIITTQVWNQHGNTHINALMEAADGELIFIINTSVLHSTEILNERRAITNICNPLNGTVQMQVTLNDNSVFNKDITFTNAPSFPTGLENRNPNWQKVQLIFQANNPFWYAEADIIESFYGVEPLFTFPFTMSPSAPIIFGNVIPSKTAYNSGQVEAPIVIEIKGACVNPVITNETTGEYISFNNLVMTANQRLIIDTTFGQKKVELDGYNVFNKLNYASTFFNLEIGENVIDFSDETGTPDATVSFIYKNLYVTI